MYDVGGVAEVYGGTFPTVTWHDFMATALADQPVLDFAPLNNALLPSTHYITSPSLVARRRPRSQRGVRLLVQRLQRLQQVRTAGFHRQHQPDTPAPTSPPVSTPPATAPSGPPKGGPSPQATPDTGGH